MRVFLVLFWLAASFVAGLLASGGVSSPAGRRLLGRWTLLAWALIAALPALVLRVAAGRFRVAVWSSAGDWGELPGLEAAIAGGWAIAYLVGYLLGGLPVRRRSRAGAASPAAPPVPEGSQD